MTGLATLVHPLEVVGSIPRATPILMPENVLPLSHKRLDLCMAWMTT